MKPSWNFTPTTPQPSQNLVERWWNPRGALPQTTPDHPAALAEPGDPDGTLMEPSSRGTLPQTTPDHPAALAEPGGTLVEPSWNPRGTSPQGRPGPPRTLSGLRPQSFQLLGKKHLFAVPCSGRTSRRGCSGTARAFA